jgi:anti-sigma factor RsiW
MNCEQIARLFPDYLQRSLGNDELIAVKRHLEGCGDCREHAALWQQLALLPPEQPSENLRARFDTMLSAFEEGRWENTSLESARRRLWPAWTSGSWLRMPLAQTALALIFLTAGFFGGRHFEAAPGVQTQELTAMHRELGSMRQLVVLSMLQNQLASERLQGVTWSRQVESPDPEILAALLHTLRLDPSVDVRLAALDALRRDARQPQVRAGLMDSLQAQQSPLVQIALIDLLVELRESDAATQLRKFQQTPDLNPAVKQRAQWGIQQLS